MNKLKRFVSTIRHRSGSTEKKQSEINTYQIILRVRRKREKKSDNNKIQSENIESMLTRVN